MLSMLILFARVCPAVGRHRNQGGDMKRHWRTLSCLVGAGGLLVAALALSGSAAVAATAQDGGTFTCTGTIDSPGILAGPHTNVVISGACVVNAGPATVNG